MLIQRKTKRPKEDVSFFGGGTSGFFGPLGGMKEHKLKRDGPFRFNLMLYSRRKTDADA